MESMEILIGSAGVIATSVVGIKKLLKEIRIGQLEYKPNGGTSLRDAVDRIDKNVTDIHHRLVDVEEFVTSKEDEN